MELISKNDVIKALQKWNCRDYDSLTINPYEVLRDIPTVEERNVGEWLDNGDRYYRCSLCGMKDTDNWKFCRGCGAYMKGE